MRRAGLVLVLSAVARAPWQQVHAHQHSECSLCTEHARDEAFSSSLTVGVWCQNQLNKRLVLDVNFETSKDYDITSAYAVRGWNTTEGHMKVTTPAACLSFTSLACPKPHE